jgi:DNA modification methylase
MIKWKLESRKFKELKKYTKNPRRLTKEQYKNLKISIDKFGLIDRPIVNLDGTIIGGHQRIEVMEKDGNPLIDCWVPSQQLNDKQVEELNIRLNKNTGEFDWDILANEYEVTDLLEWGFNAEEMFACQDAEEIEPEEESEILEPAADNEAFTKLGDYYDLNDHRIVCGDSTIPDVVTLCIQSNEPVLMVTDPPYGVNYDPMWRNDIKSAGKFISATKMNGAVLNDDQADWRLAYAIFPGNVAYVWHGGKHAGTVSKNLEDCGFEIVNQIIWNKQNFAFGRGDYHWKHEPCYYAVRKGKSHNWQGDRKQHTIWDISNLNPVGRSNDDNKDDKVEGHGTQKPIECMAKPIRNNTRKGDGVYDPFLGSGTTLIAAEQLNRICYGIELSPSYCDIIVKRWIKLMDKNNKSVIIKHNGKEINKEDLYGSNSKTS